MSRISALHMFALSANALAVAGASCVLAFPDLELDEGATATSTSSGGTGGATTSGITLSPDGAPCSVNEECLNAQCLPSNTGDGSVCCALACPDMGAASCATNGNCDAQGRSCALYPAGAICGQTASCEQGMLTSMQCHQGSCEHVSSSCPGSFTCEDEYSCKTDCVTANDCKHPSAECLGGKCVQPAGAPCDANDQCESSACGTTGVGRCCTVPCLGAEDECGPTDCNEAGACIYPNTACGPAPSCMGATLTSAYCDEMGNCGRTRVAKPCPGRLVCDDALSCHETCGSNDSTGDAFCTQGSWCDGLVCVPAGGLSAICNRGTQCLTGVCITLFGRCL